MQVAPRRRRVKKRKGYSTHLADPRKLTINPRAYPEEVPPERSYGVTRVAESVHSKLSTIYRLNEVDTEGCSDRQDCLGHIFALNGVLILLPKWCANG